MSRGELIEMRQLQRLTRNAEVMGPCLLPLSALPDPQERSAWPFPTLQVLRNQPPSALLLLSRSGSRYEYMAVISAARARSELLLGDSCWLELSIFFPPQNSIRVRTRRLLGAALRRDERAPCSSSPRAGRRSGKVGFASEEKAMSSFGLLTVEELVFFCLDRLFSTSTFPWIK